MPAILIDAVILATLATVLRFWNSRVAAFLLIIFGSAAVAVTAMNKFGVPIAGMSSGGSNIVLALIALWLAIKSFEATTKLHGVYSETV